MIGTVLLALAAVFLGWLGLTVDNRELGGLFIVGSILFTGSTILWFLDARQLKRSQR